MFNVKLIVSQLLFLAVVHCELGSSAVDYLPQNDTDCQYNRYNGGYVVDKTDCRRFFNCANGRMVYNVCPIGSYYKPGHGCSENRPDNCTDTWDPPPTTEKLAIELPAATPSPSIQSLLRSSNNTGLTTELQCVGRADGVALPSSAPPSAGSAPCAAYIVCWSQRAHRGQCPLGYSFNAPLGRCDTANNGQCRRASDACPPRGLHLMRAPHTCTEYYECVDGTQMRKRCAAGMQFDDQQNRCAPSAKVRCYACPPPRDEEQPVDEVSLTTPYSVEGGNQGGQTRGRGAVVTLASAESCAEYFVCAGGEPHRMRCALGLEWNVRTEQCDLPERAQCSHQEHPAAQTAVTMGDLIGDAAEGADSDTTEEQYVE